MREKDLKKRLSAEAASVLPDDGRIKKEIKREFGTEALTAAYAHGGTGRTGKGRNIIITLAAFFVAVALALGIALPIVLGNGNTPFIPDNKFGSIQSTEDFYAYGAASVGALISSEPAATSKIALKTKTAAASKPTAVSADVKTPTISGEDKATVDRYLALVDGLLSDGKIQHTERELTDGAYAYAMTVRYTDLLGNEISYEMRYNREFVDGETDGDEREEEYSIAGVLIIEGVQYPVYGSLETEEEDGEREQELRFRAQTSQNGYIEVEQETEEEDGEKSHKYVYSVFEGGQRVERTKVEYEQEKNKLKLKMEVEKANGERDVLHFEEKSKGGNRVLSVQAEMNGGQVEFTVYVSQGADGRAEYRYEFD